MSLPSKTYGPKEILKFLFSEDLYIFDIFNIIKDDPSVFPEITNLQSFDSGVSTIVYRKSETSVLCLSIDYNKVLYLKNSSFIPGFKFLRFAPYQYNGYTHFAMIYEMDYLLQVDTILSSDSIESLDMLSEFETSDYIDDEIEYILDSNHVLIDYDVIDKLLSRQELPHIHYDLHTKQFLADSNHNIICVDPILSRNICH